MIGELKSEALKERHWQLIMRRLDVSWNLNELTLGQIWQVDLQRATSFIRETLSQAQGEKALEEYLKQVIVAYHNKMHANNVYAYFKSK